MNQPAPSPSLATGSGWNAATEPLLKFFQYEHLPANLRAVSEPWCSLAHHVARTIPPSAERTVALRKLLEGKDAAVRAAL